MMQKLIFDIATTNSSGRKTKNWKNKKIEWEVLRSRLSTTVRTSESTKEYHALPKSAQAEKKDHGGFVGGYLTGGKRTVLSVAHRWLVCLDLDSATPEAWDKITATYGFECLVYSTHSHLPEKPRLRLIIPLSRAVTPDEYQAIGRRIAEQIGMEMFDPTTFQPSRLMYWPSTPSDGEFYYQTQQADTALDPEEILSTYVDPKDISAWPQHPAEKDVIKRTAAKQGDPRDKEGLIGAFCRAYSVLDAMGEFIPQVYDETAYEDRFTYVAGTSAAGAIVYDDTFIYSHHGTDPIQGHLCNAFDMVRIHLYGALDLDSEARTTQSLPSFKKMMQLLTTLPEVIKESVHADFSDIDEATEGEIDLKWVEALTVDRWGEIEPTIPNFEVIIDNDPLLKGRFYYDEFEDRTFGQLPLPWDKGDRVRDLKDIDDSNLESYISKRYKIHHAGNIKKAFDNISYRYKKHPVRDYLDTLEWDGKKRVETLLIDYLGAEDSEYVRTVSRKMLCACAARIYFPGAKFDNTIILIGPEGIFKSTFIARLGRGWFSDSFVGVTGVDSMQQLQGTWLMEMPELDGLKKAEITAIKSFLSKTMDKYRSSYGRRNNVHPRQTVFWGTTNEENPLKGDTGNRRFWPVVVRGVSKDKFNQLQGEVDQIWAEAKYYVEQGEDLDLPAHIKIEAKEMQKKHTESDSRKGMIMNFLEMPLPDNWDEMTRTERYRYVNGDDHEDITSKGTHYRTRVCAAEVWVELFGGNLKDLNTYNTKPIHEMLATIPGWEKTENPITFSVYGRQRGFVRLKSNEMVKTKIETFIEDIL